MRPLEAGGSLHPLPSGTCKDTWGFAASLSWATLGTGLSAAETEIGVLQEAKERVAHTWFLITQSHFYILFGY